MRPLPRAAPDPAQDYLQAELDEKAARALRESERIRAPHGEEIATPAWRYSHFLMYGQSLGQGAEAWPLKTREPIDGALMLGDSVRPSVAGAEYRPLGSATLKPLVATTQGSQGGPVLGALEILSLKPGDAALGETPLEGAMKFALQGVNADEQSFVASNASVGATTIEQLSKGTSLYSGLVDAVRKVKSVAGPSYGIAALFWLGGEYNYVGTYGGTTDKDEYKSKLKQLYIDFVEDAAFGIAGQSGPPPMITYQTGGSYARDGVSIGQAQFELSKELTGWFLAAPSYPVTDKGAHLDANGSRWLGNQLGKVWTEVVRNGRGWRPTSPLRATWRNSTVLLEFHVPVAPLRIEPFYRRGSPEVLRSCGFSVIDAAGLVPIRRVAIERGVLVQIMCHRPLRGPVEVRYGEEQSGGKGNLCDSDPTVATSNYEYREYSKDYSTARIPKLIGKPYPLWNWCIAFTMEASPEAALPPPPYSPVPRRRRPVSFKWIAYAAAALIGAAFATTIFVYARGVFVKGHVEAVGLDSSGTTIVGKQCVYRALIGLREIYVGQTSTDIDKVAAIPCPDHMQ